MKRQNGFTQLPMDFGLAPPAPVAQLEPGPWVAWANNLLSSDAVILDTETTGLDKLAQIISLAIIDMRGNTLFNSLLRPTVAIDPCAFAIHRITNRQLAGAPTIGHVHGQLSQMLAERKILIWNSAFDLRMLRQTMAAAKLDPAWVDGLTVECAMRAHAQAKGLKGNARLEGGDHTAAGDCMAVLNLIRKMTYGHA